MKSFAAVLAALVALASFPIPSVAGTTGGIAGRIVDATTQAPVAGVSVTVTSPSQSERTTSDANGNYRFLTLIPDAYTVSMQKTGYDPASQAGISVFADQVQNVNISMNPSIREIARVRSRAASDVVKPGTTSDVYSVNSAGAQAAASLVGPGGLSNSYGAIASVPGVAIDAGEQGWFQTVHIRGGDIDQVGYELDGIPVNRAYDNAPQSMLSSLGQQELQVYTGGTPATAEAQGIAGYINQVIKTGTYPGFGILVGGLGTPTFYHKLSAEAGGSSPNRNFSYYVGISGANQDYRYLDNSNGAGAFNYFFYPVSAVPTSISGDTCLSTGQSPTAPVWACGNEPSLFANGQAFGIANTTQRDNVVNVHFGLPHKNTTLRDDFQLMWLTSEVVAGYYSSINDLGADVVSKTYGPLAWDDGRVYTGPVMQPFNPGKVVQYFYPSSQMPRAFQMSPLPSSLRDVNDNGVAVFKAQYQHNINSNSFLRLYGYSLYSNWFIWGPNSASQPQYGAELADYEIPDHTYGFNLTYTNQMNAHHLVSLGTSYTASHLQRYSNGFIRSNPPITTLVDGAGNCVDLTGTPVACYGSAAQTGTTTNPTPAPAPAGAQWLVTDTGYKANLNQVHTRFTSAALTDEWRPNDRLTVNGGVRVENYAFPLGDTSPNDPARAFWFKHYNAEHCFGPGLLQPVLAPNNGLGACASGTTNVALVNESGGTLSATRWQPRLGFTYESNPDTVWRGSFGVYARPENSSWVQYNTVQEDLASFLGAHFYSYGFTTPRHDIHPDTSYNFDLSLEKRLHNTDWSFKLTPFYRSTKDQLQNFFIDPLTGLESGLNVGHQISYGVEFALRKGDFAREGLSGALAYTYTHSRIQYHNFDNTNRNVIDNLNDYINQYNGYTKSGGGAPCYNNTLQLNSNGSISVTGSTPNPGCNAIAIAPTATTPGASGAITNPYYSQPAQPLMDRNAYYTTYDVVPGPVSAANGYETPHVASLILNYRHKRFAITPSLTYNSGASYGAPLVWPGYTPDSCLKPLAGGGTAADPAFCSSSNTNLPFFIPDKYTGHFDNLGEFKQPWRVSANLGMSYEASNHVSFNLALTNIIDRCGQRGYAWDQNNVCVYATLPSGIFNPAGNFYPNSQAATAPPQMQFPYSFWLNNNNTGFVGVKLPFEATFNVNIKL